MDYYLFLGEDSWGPMTHEQATTFAAVNQSMFECEQCSGNGVVVYHNTVGRRRHATKEQVKEFLSYLPDIL